MDAEAIRARFWSPIVCLRFTGNRMGQAKPAELWQFMPGHAGFEACMGTCVDGMRIHNVTTSSYSPISVEQALALPDV